MILNDLTVDLTDYDNAFRFCVDFTHEKHKRWRHAVRIEKTAEPAWVAQQLRGMADAIEYAAQQEQQP